MFFDNKINLFEEPCMEPFISKYSFFKFPYFFIPPFWFISSGIEWIPINKVSLDQEKTKSVLNFLTILEDDDDVQHVYANLKIDNAKLQKALTAW